MEKLSRLVKSLSPEEREELLKQSEKIVDGYILEKEASRD